MNKKQRLALFGIMAMIAMMCLAWGCAVPLPIETDYIKDKALDGVAKHQVKNAVTKTCNAEGIHDQHTINLLTKQVMARLASLSPEQRAGAATFISVFVTEVVIEHQQQQGVQAAKPSTEPKRLEMAKLPPKQEYTRPVPKSNEIGRDGRFITYDNGTVKDTSTGLMWAARDNGKDINWHDAKRYCENYRGGGYSDWRMPTQEELQGLYDKSRSYVAKQRAYHIHLTELIQLTTCCPWASETRGSRAAHFDFGSGGQGWGDQSYSGDGRALLVRAGN